MTKECTTTTSRDFTRRYNRIFYVAFLLLAIYFWFSGDQGAGLSNAGIALIFDPFDPKVPWNRRSYLQQGWLFTHLALLLIGVAVWWLS